MITNKYSLRSVIPSKKQGLLIFTSALLGVSMAVSLLYLQGTLSRAAAAPTQAIDPIKIVPPSDFSAIPARQGPSCPLDVAVVFDVSGSMDYETPCFGCWQKNPISSTNIIANPYPTNGNFNPLPDITTTPLCTANPTPISQGGFNYLAHEAELYSRDVSLHGWEFNQRSPGQGFWVL